MTILVAFLVVLALVLFVLAAINVNSPRINLTAAGLACLTLAYLITHWPG
jgi:hypothetical protein